MNSNGAGHYDDQTLPKIARDIEAQIAAIRAQNAQQQAMQPAAHQAHAPVTPADIFARQALNPAVFEAQAEALCKGMFHMLVSKHREHGISVFSPVQIFSRADVQGRIDALIDEDLWTVKNKASELTKDEITNLIGRLILKQIALELHSNG